MSSSIVPLSVFSDLLILGVLGAAVASSRVSVLARPVIATFAFVCAWLATAVFDGMRAPGWTIFLGVVVILLSLGAVALTLHAWTQQSDPGDDGASDEGPRGPGCVPPAAPQGGGTDPSWWPEFERQFALCDARSRGESCAPIRSSAPL